MAKHRAFLKNVQITYYPRFSFTSKTGRPLKRVFCFYFEDFFLFLNTIYLFPRYTFLFHSSTMHYTDRQARHFWTACLTVSESCSLHTRRSRSSPIGAASAARLYRLRDKVAKPVSRRTTPQRRKRGTT